MSEKFRGVYEIEDGYVGKGRSQYVYISSSDLEDDMTDKDLIEFYEQEIQDDFEQKIRPYPKRVEEFLTLAKEQIKNIDE